jgi:asparagine synthase (glutamine-hydrolysing)
LAYNGEVYNYQDLRNQLLNKGHEFKTQSDTEVVLLWLKENGTKGLSAFKGMFALTFIDLGRKQVIIARDRHGIKPLFFYKADDKLIISSTINAIEACGLANLTINDKAISDYLSYRHVMGNYTFYQEAQSCDPGIATVYNETLSGVNSVIETQSIEEDRDLKNILIDTISMVYEAPTSPGLMLSGGVDSTLLLAILNKELGISKVNTYTLGYGEDGKWAKKAAVQYDSRHHEVPVSMDALQRMDEFLKYTDQPIADHGAFATWLVAGEATKTSNVLLSGSGADELFAGYNRHRAFNYYLKNQRQALNIQSAINKLGLMSFLPKSAQQLFKGLDTNPTTTYQNFLQNHGIENKENPDIIWEAPKSLAENLEKAIEFDRSHYLVADVLAVTDNSMMQHSIEARIPYLYDDVLSFAGNIASQDKIKNNGKAPLKKILADYDGLKYTQRPKLGFGLPMADWLRDKRSFWLWEFLLKDSPVFKYVPKINIYQLLRLHQLGKTDNSMQLWSILVLEKWLKHFYS